MSSSLPDSHMLLAQTRLRLKHAPTHAGKLYFITEISLIFITGDDQLDNASVKNMSTKAIQISTKAKTIRLK